MRIRYGKERAKKGATIRTVFGMTKAEMGHGARKKAGRQGDSFVEEKSNLH